MTVRRWEDNPYRDAIAGSAITSLVLVALTLAVLVTGDNSLESTVVVLLVSVALVTSLQLFVGNSGILSFGHVAFMGVGAYVTALTTIPGAVRETQLPNLPAFLQGVELGLVPAVLAASGSAAVLGFLVGSVLVRMNVNAFVMSTFALLIVGFTVMVNWIDVTRGGQGVFAIPRLTDPVVAMVGAVLFVVVARLFKASGTGLRLRASREDELAARAAGIDVPRVRLVGFVLSAAMMGAAGSLWAMNVIAFDPDQFSFAMTFSLLAMLVVGGRESVLGGVLGAGVVVIVTELLSRVEQGVTIGSVELPRIAGTVQFALAALIIVSLVWRPDGLVGRREAEDLVPRKRTPRSPVPAADGAAPTGATVARAAVVEDATPDGPSARRPDGPVLVARGLSKSFGGVRALAEVDLELRAGEILGVIGPNGSGKSTLLNVLSGVTAPDAGQVLLNGVDISRSPSHRTARRGLARTFQNIRLFGHLTVLENAMAPYGARPEVVRDSLVALDLADVRRREADTLSYGRQRRLEIARATAARPAVLLLDEPAAGMNEAESDVLMEDIRAIARDEGCAIVIIDHDLRLIVRLCDRIQVLETGRTLAVDSPERIIANPAVQAAYLGDMTGLGLEARAQLEGSTT